MLHEPREPVPVSPYSAINDAIELVTDGREHAQDADTLAKYTIVVGLLLQARYALLEAQKSFRDNP